MFDLLAETGWLQNATFPAELAPKLEAQAKAALEKKLAEKIVPQPFWVQEWEETERGWGTRPDGFTAHRSKTDIGAFLLAMRRKERAGRPEGYVPDEYSRPVGQPFRQQIPPNLIPQHDSEFGFWLPAGWQPVRVQQANGVSVVTCDDCHIATTEHVTKGDHHGGEKTVCRDRDACHRRNPS